MSVVANLAINLDARGAAAQLRQFQSQSQATQRAAEALQSSASAVGAEFTKTGRQIQTAANGMRYFIDATGRARKENGQFVTTTEAAAAGLRRQGQAAQQTSRAVDALGGAVRNTVAAFSLIQAGRFIFAKTAELETQTRSLQVLTGSADKARQIISQLQQLGAVTPFTSTELIDAAKRLQAFGVEADRVVETTRRLADVSGATGAELQGLVTAYGQVQAKGRLQGEELLQFQERGVALQEVLRKEYGMTGEEFQKALSKGQISAAAVEYALIKLTETGGKYANGAVAQSDTLTGRLSTLQDGIEQLARSVGDILSPAIRGILNEAVFAVNQINNLISTANRAKGFGLGEGQRKQLLDQASREAESIVNRRRIANPFERNRQFQEIKSQRERDLIEAYGMRTGQIKQESAVPTIPRAQALPPLTGGTAAARATGADKTASRLNQLLMEQLKINVDLGIVGKSKLEQLHAQKNSLESLLQLQLKQVSLESKGQEGMIARQNVLKQYELEGKRILKDIGNIEKEIRDLTTESLALGVSIFAGALPTESPLTQEIQRVKDELAAADSKAEDLLNKLSELGGVEPQTDVARKALVKARGDIAAMDPQQLAGQRLAQSDIDALTKQNEDLRNAGRDLTTLDQLVIKYGKDWEKISPTIRKQLEDLAKTNDELTESQEKQQQIKGLYDGIASTIEEGIVASIQSGIDSLLSGTKDFGDALKEIASGVLKEIADMLIKFAVRQAFSAMGFADGGVFAAGGLTPFAQGGIVSRPTIFPFANGGTARMGLMGEAGPEAIMPLKRGSDGKLGVVADMGAAMDRYRPPHGYGMASGSGGSTATTATGGGPLVVEVRAQMERINSVDYVTAEQFQAGIQQAAQQGAAQGEQRTLKRLQHSPATRRRVGV